MGIRRTIGIGIGIGVGSGIEIGIRIGVSMLGKTPFFADTFYTFYTFCGYQVLALYILHGTVLV